MTTRELLTTNQGAPNQQLRVPTPNWQPGGLKAPNWHQGAQGPLTDNQDVTEAPNWWTGGPRAPN